VSRAKNSPAPHAGTVEHTTEITVSIPPDVRELARLQREAEDDAAALACVDVADAVTLADADAFLTDVVRRKDAALAMRKRATGPMYTAAKEIESWFRPLMAALEGAERGLKNVIGAYRMRQLDTERQARELAAQAAEGRDPEALVTALTVAADAGAKDGARATTRYAWTVKRIIPDLLPDEWWSPDEARIAAFAKAAPGEGDEPVIPGVRFERVAIVGARR
jgi:hypothetical protein